MKIYQLLLAVLFNSVKAAWRGHHGSPGSMSCYRPFSSLKEPSSQALNLLERTSFISWNLRCPFLGECWRGLGNFWSCWVCLSYGPASEPSLKKCCAKLFQLVECTSLKENILPLAVVFHTAEAPWRECQRSLAFSSCGQPSSSLMRLSSHSGDLMRLAVFWTPVRDHRWKLVWITHTLHLTELLHITAWIIIAVLEKLQWNKKIIKGSYLRKKRIICNFSTDKFCRYLWNK